MTNEYILEQVKTMLENKLSDEITIIESFFSSSLETPSIVEYKIGQIDPTRLDLPALCVSALRTSSGKDDYQLTERQTRIQIVTWIVNEDEEDLHRICLRYGDAINEVLQKEINWPNNLHNPSIKDTSYSDYFESDLGLVEGVLNEIDISYYIDN